MGFFASGLLYADSVSDAKSARRAARAKFYQALIENPQATPQEQERLKQTILAPAQKNYTKSINEEYRKKYVSPNLAPVRKITDPREVKRRKDALDAKFKRASKALLTAMKGQKSEGQKENSPAAPSSGGYQFDTGPSRPEVELDGSGIPKEIEFKGKSAAPPAKTKLPVRR